jgi:predicted nucleic-acid-binding protein
LATTVAVDTNVLVRLLVGDEPRQKDAVVRRLGRLADEGGAAVVHPVVLAELSWMLRASYGLGRDEIAGALERLLDTAPFVVHQKAEVLQALAWFRDGPADFSDYLVVALTTVDGADTLLTFDRHLLKHPGASRP